MALITCPECGKQISDKAAACIHCGYPLADINCNNHESIIKVLSSPSYTPEPTSTKISETFSLFSADNEYVNLECQKCGKIYRYGRLYHFLKVTSQMCIPNAEIKCANCGNSAEAYSQILPKHKITIFDKTQLKMDDTLRCPRCKSTSVTTGQRGYSIWTGFLGSSKTVNRCGKCGHSWKP